MRDAEVLARSLLDTWGQVQRSCIDKNQGGIQMKRYMGLIIAGVLFLVIAGFGYSYFAGPSHAYACGWGKSGGDDYVPQRRGPTTGSLYNKPFLTKEQAYDVVDNHVRKLNPALRIGQINDEGSYYQAEILAESGEVVQRLGVDKESGQIMLLN